MRNQLTNPLQQLVAKASATLPQTTGEVAQAKSRIEHTSSRGTLVLVDVSGSMASPAWGGHSKHKLLSDALAATAAGHEIMAFADTVSMLADRAALPQPAGGTALHFALHAALQREPGRILLISDGEPDDEAAALAVATRFSGVIDVLYIGPDSNAGAMRFLRALAVAGHGRYQDSDIARPSQPALTYTLRRMIQG